MRKIYDTQLQMFKTIVMMLILCMSQGDGHESRGIHRVSHRRFSSLDAEVAQEVCVCLDAVTLLVIIGQIDQLQSQVGPQPLQSSSIQPSHVEHFVLETQHMCCVDVLQKRSY